MGWSEISETDSAESKNYFKRAKFWGETFCRNAFSVDQYPRPKRSCRIAVGTTKLCTGEREAASSKVLRANRMRLRLKPARHGGSRAMRGSRKILRNRSRSPKRENFAPIGSLLSSPLSPLPQNFGKGNLDRQTRLTAAEEWVCGQRIQNLQCLMDECTVDIGYCDYHQWMNVQWISGIVTITLWQISDIMTTCNVNSFRSLSVPLETALHFPKHFCKIRYALNCDLWVTWNEGFP